MTAKLFFQAIVKFLLGVVLVGALIFWPAGSFAYWRGWLLMAILFIPMFCAGIVMMCKNPRLLASRLQAKEKQVLLSVADTGPGIDPELLPLLFERYLHHDVLLPPPHGLGLGLPLCRSIAQRHGGTLLADSVPGKGSRFVCALPMRQTAPRVSDVPYDYAGGFNRTLLALADALPPKAFLVRNQD